jgi:aromatic amino acid aminotransferase I / 2-aminoadipate transaminase
MSSSEHKAIDLSHHISHFARRYEISPLKGIQKRFGKDLIPLAGGVFISSESHYTLTSLSGLPSPDYFPFTSISADTLPVDAFPLIVPHSTSAPSSSPFSWLWRLFGASKDDTTRVEIPHKPRPGDGGLNLTTALQYGPATGLERTRTFIREFTDRIHSPAYDDWATIVDTGNTDGCALLCCAFCVDLFPKKLCLFFFC